MFLEHSVYIFSHLYVQKTVFVEKKLVAKLTRSNAKVSPEYIAKWCELTEPLLANFMEVHAEDDKFVKHYFMCGQNQSNIKYITKYWRRNRFVHSIDR